MDSWGPLRAGTKDSGADPPNAEAEARGRRCPNGGPGPAAAHDSERPAKISLLGPARGRKLGGVRNAREDERVPLAGPDAGRAHGCGDGVGTPSPSHKRAAKCPP
eukprot:7207020-Alexandrium_andersonii.AAC.1